MYCDGLLGEEITGSEFSPYHARAFVCVSEIKIKTLLKECFDYILVGDEGFEPPVPDSESGALPLGESPTVELSVGNFSFLQAPLFMMLLLMPFLYRMFFVRRLLDILLSHMRGRRS